MAWQTFSGAPLKDDLFKTVEETIIKETKQGNRLKVCIGTDSQVKNGTIEFATVIVFLRERRGGFMYVNKTREKAKMELKRRMIIEVGKSVDIAYKLCDLLEKYDIPLEVHADINTDPNFQSNTALSEAMGYILSMGFVFKAKPNAFASSSCADKLV